MRIAIMGINYAPELTGIGPYTTRLADHFALTNDVVVYTGLPHYPDWRLPDGWNRGEHSIAEANPLVHRARHYIPRRQSATRRALYELSWSINTLKLAATTPVDVVIAVVPPLFGMVAAHLIGRRFNAPVGVIVQDIMSSAAEQSGVSGGQSAAQVVARFERWGLRHATGVATIHPQLANKLRDIVGMRKQPRVIYNWTHIEQYASASTSETRQLMGWGDETVVLHSGNMGLKQNLHAVLDAAVLSHSQGRSTRFVMSGGGNEFASLAARAASMPNVDVVAGVSAEDFPSLLQAADVLLVNERPGMDSMSLPSKLTSYFTSGRPVVAAVESYSATASFIEAAGAGSIVPPSEPAQLLRAVDRLTKYPELGAELGQNARGFASKYLTEEHALAEYDSWVQELLLSGRAKAKG